MECNYVKWDMMGYNGDIWGHFIGYILYIYYLFIYLFIYLFMFKFIYLYIYLCIPWIHIYYNQPIDIKLKQSYPVDDLDII